MEVKSQKKKFKNKFSINSKLQALEENYGDEVKKKVKLDEVIEKPEKDIFKTLQILNCGSSWIFIISLVLI